MSEIVAHRGCPDLAPENMIPAFLRALELDADAVELDVVAYTALQRGRAADARAVHLHPSQLNETTLHLIRSAGIEIHAWDVNDHTSLELVRELGIPRLDTDRLQQALDFRKGNENGI